MKTQRQILDERCDQILATVAPEFASELLAEVIAEASRYWYAEGIDPTDFCLQSNPISFSGTIVFGGTNRVTWNPRSGFRPDPSYCNTRFLDHARFIASAP